MKKAKKFPLLLILIGVPFVVVSLQNDNGRVFAAAQAKSKSPEKTVQEDCGRCHGLKIDGRCMAGDCEKQRTLTTVGRDWERLINWMKFFNCELPAQDQKTVAEYLKSQFPGNPYPISWTHVETVPMGWNIVSMLSAGEFLYAGVEGGGRIYRTRDGQNWSEVADTGQGTVYGITAFKGKLYAGTDVTRPEVWNSSDGAEWTRAARFPDEENGISAMGVFKGNLYAGTRRTSVYRSPDGKVWRRVARLEEERLTYFRFLIPFKDHLYAGYEPGGRIFRSPDGLHWTEVGRDLPSPNGVRGVAVFNGSLYVGTSSPVQIWKTDNGTRWEKVFDPTPGIKQGYVGSLAVFQDRLYAGVNAHTKRPIDVYRTQDGREWEGTGEITPFTIEAMGVLGENLYLGATMPPNAWIYRTTGLNPSFRQTAAGEIPVRGNVTGSALDTWTGYDQYEVIRGESGNPESLLEHKWLFNIKPAARLTLAVQAFHSDPGNDLRFAYSRDDKVYHELFKLTHTRDDQAYQVFPLPDINGDRLYIRARGEPGNINRKEKGKTEDTLYVDHLFVLSEGNPVTRTGIN